MTAADLLLPQLLELWARLVPRLSQARGWLGDVLRPAEGVEVYCRDGGVVTGILVVDQGIVVASFIVRARASRRRQYNHWPDDPDAWPHWAGPQ